MEDSMFQLMQTLKAITDENRVRILAALKSHELCVCQITGMLDLAPSTTSKHLSILRQARLIESRKKGKWVYYTVPDQGKAPAHIRQALDLVMETVGASPEIVADARHIEDIITLSCGQGADDTYHSPAVHSLDPVEE